MRRTRLRRLRPRTPRLSRPRLRTLLLSRLRQEHPGTAAALHWMCTAWHANTDQPTDAAPGSGTTGHR